jgi:hypothetical protein
MERNLHIGNRKIMTIYSKKMKTTIRGIKDTMKENIEECIGPRNWEKERGDGKRKFEVEVENEQDLILHKASDFPVVLPFLTFLQNCLFLVYDLNIFEAHLQ